MVSTLRWKELLPRIKQTPPHVLAALDGLHHTEGMFIGIGVAEPCPSTNCWMYFPGSDSPFYRVTYLSNYSPKMAPGREYFSLLAEVSVSAYKHENPDDVIERTIQGMVNCQLLTPEQAQNKIVSRELMRVPYSYPVPTLSRDAALEVIQPWLMENDVYSRGRFGAWRYEVGNMDHSVAQGVEWVNRILEDDRENELTYLAKRGC